MTTYKRSDTGATVAGYEYQFIWSAQRALELLVPKTDLQQIVVEGIHGKDEKAIGKPEDFWGVDLSEYYGGRSRKSASCIVISQMKYASASPNRAWTVARLCQNKSGKKHSSVLSRLGDVFDKFYKDMGPVGCREKIKIRVITNQPLAPNALKLFQKTCEQIEALEVEPGKLNFSTLLKQSFTKAEKEDLVRIVNASRLKKRAVCVFLQCIDLEYFDSPSFCVKQAQLNQEFARFSDIQPDGDLFRAQSLIKDSVIDRKTHGISREDVLHALQVSDYDLNPAPCLISVPAKVIQTEDCDNVAESIKKNGGQKLLLHGVAGVGKSISLSRVESKLNAGSCVVIYDCFGSGKEQIPSRQRYRENIAVTQLINEISIRTGTGKYLFLKSFSTEGSWNRLEEIVEIASEKLESSDSQLVIVVDAADNAIDSFERDSGRKAGCFVFNLWRLQLPPNVVLLMSCRTHRRDSLRAPQEVNEIEVHGFSSENSAEHLRQRFRSMDDSTCSKFHDATVGNPRLQYYWLTELTQGTKRSASHLITSTPHYGLAELYQNWLEEAQSGLQAGLGQDHVLTTLTAIRRPIRSDVLAGALNVSPSDANIFLDGLSPGLKHADAQFQYVFRDEDFEDFLNQKCNEDSLRSAHDAIASFCIEIIDDGDYCTRWAHHHLWHAGRLQEVVQIAIDQRGVTSLDQHFVPECSLDRCSVGLQAAARTGNLAAAIKLMLIAAQEQRRNELFQNSLTNYPGLAVAHGRTDVLLKDLEHYPTENDFDSGLLWSAREVGQHEALSVQAQRILREGERWIRFQLARKREGASSRLGISADDVTEHTLAAFFLFGTNKAVRSLKNWRPASLLLEVAHDSFSYLKRRREQKVLTQLVNEVGGLSITQAACLAGCYSPGAQWNKRKLQLIATRLLFSCRRHTNYQDLLGSWFVPFLELCAASSIENDLIHGLAELWSVPQFTYPETPYSSEDWFRVWDKKIRFFALTSVVHDDELSAEALFAQLVSVDPKRAEDEHYKKRKSELESLLSNLLPAYLFRAKCIVKGRWSKKLGSEFENRARDTHRIRSQRSFRWPAALNAVPVRVLTDAYSAARCNSAEEIIRLIHDTRLALGHDCASTLLRISDSLSCHRRHDDLTEQVLDIFVEELGRSSLFAKDQIEMMMDAANVALRFNRELSRDLYDKAYELATEVDYGTDRYIDCIMSAGLHLSEKADSATTARTEIARSLLALFEDRYPFIEENGELEWPKTISAIVGLDPQIGLDACVDWERKGRISLDSATQSLVRSDSQSRFLSPSYRLALLELIQPFQDLTEVSLPIYGELNRSERPKAQIEFKNLVTKTIRDCPASQRKYALKNLLDWARVHRVNRDIVEEITRFQAFSESLPDIGPKARVSPQRQKERSIKVQAIQRKASKAPLVAIHEFLAAVKSDPISTRWEPISDILIEFGKRLPDQDRLDGLNTLAASSTISFGVDQEVLGALLGLVTHWKNRGRVRNWALQELPKLLQKTIPKLTNWSGVTKETVNKIVSAIGSDPNEQMKLIIDAVGKSLEECSPTSLYLAAQLLFDDCGSEDLIDVLRWEFNRSSFEIPPPCDDSVPPTAASLTSRLIWNLLNHPDLRVRWRAIHCASKILDYEPSAFLHELCSYLDNSDDEYWMSARQWLLFFLLHVAEAMPEHLIPHVNRLATLALDEAFPHVAHQELAKKCCEKILAIDDTCLPNEIAAKISVVNSPRLCLLPWAREVSRAQGKGDRSESFRFQFDMMDTFPYWYSPLARRFAQHRCDVAERADRWVSDHWGITKEDCRKFGLRPMSSSEWSLTTHGHGSLPTIERPDTYYERHAMYLAAGEMIRELPVIAEEDGVYEWQYWLDSNVFEADPSISSSRRDAPPLKSVFYTLSEQVDLDQWLPVVEEEIENAVIQNDEEESWITVCADYHVFGFDRTLAVDIDCALASPKTANALRLALETTDYPFNYGLPIWDVELNQFSDLSVYPRQWPGTKQELLHALPELPGYGLNPLTVNVGISREIDGKDPWWPNGSRAWYVPTPDFIRDLDLDFSPTSLAAMTNQGEPMTESRTWNEEHVREGDSDTWSYGKLLRVRSQALLRYLDSNERVLITRCVFRKERKDQRVIGGEDRDFGTTKIFIVRPDGRFDF